MSLNCTVVWVTFILRVQHGPAKIGPLRKLEDRKYGWMESAEIQVICKLKKKKEVLDFFWHLLSFLANSLVPIIINCGTESLAVTFFQGLLESKILPVFSGSLRLKNSQFFTK